mmetsp:Transcript_35504/g.68068  ORF Transcript_35504/g.68068 Transcript_35504/m.68068 type:complete len:727 (-) Transcript_35504:749-2929(-)
MNNHSSFGEEAAGYGEVQSYPPKEVTFAGSMREVMGRLSKTTSSMEDTVSFIMGHTGQRPRQLKRVAPLVSPRSRKPSIFTREWFSQWVPKLPVHTIDPYVVAKLQPWRGLKSKTRPVMNVAGDFFYDQDLHENVMSMMVPDNIPSGPKSGPPTLRLELWDQDTMIDDLMGICEISLADDDGKTLLFCNNEERYQEMTLKTSEGERVTCKLCLRMQFTERRDMTPEMFESVNLKSFDSKNVHPIMAKSAKQLGKHLVQDMTRRASKMISNSPGTLRSMATGSGSKPSQPQVASSRVVRFEDHHMLSATSERSFPKTTLYEDAQSPGSSPSCKLLLDSPLLPVTPLMSADINGDSRDDAVSTAMVLPMSVHSPEAGLQEWRAEELQDVDNSDFEYIRDASPAEPCRGESTTFRDGYFQVTIIGVSDMQLEGNEKNFQFSDYYVTGVCLLALGIYLGTGIIFYSQVEGWSLLDSVYFCITTLSTVGYGDLLPSTNGSKIFTSFFAVLGVSIIGGALAHLVMTFFENENLAVTKFLKLTSKFRKQFIQHRESSIADRVWPIVAIIVLYYSQVLLNALFYMKYEDFTFVNAFYMVNITMMTVGFGDYFPETREGKMFAVFNILIAYSYLAKFAGHFVKVLMTKRYDALLAKLLDANTGVQYHDIRQWDVDGDETVNEIEFVRGVLIKMGKVSPQEFDLVRDRFKEIDIDNDGTLTRGELLEREGVNSTDT